MEERNEFCVMGKKRMEGGNGNHPMKGKDQGKTYGGGY